MKAALRSFRDLPAIGLQRADGLGAHEAAAEAVLSKCSKLGGVASVQKKRTSSKPVLGEEGSPGDVMQVWIAAVLLQRLLKSELRTEAAILSADPAKLKAELAAARFVLVLLSKGLWHDRTFGHTAAVINQSSSIQMLPIALEESSARPASLRKGSTSFDQKDLRGLAGDKVSSAYEALLNTPARRFTVSSSIRILQAQVQDIGFRTAGATDMPAPTISMEGLESNAPLGTTMLVPFQQLYV